MIGFNGLAMGMGDIARLSDAESRSISAENPTGEKGRGATATEGAGARAARDLGLGWKVAPSINVESGDVVTLADIEGPGQIQSMWLGGAVGRDYILRFYWDDQEQPSVECPNSDLFAIGWAHDRGGSKRGHADINSLAVNVCPNRGLNCFWPMPFRKRCRITLENRDVKTVPCYYQINYTLTEVPNDLAYFHAQFRRVNPLRYKDVYTILDGVAGRGHYVGTAMAWGVNNDGWWGEGEIKFYIDGDDQFPTICGTGTEDYFGGSYNWDVDGQYATYTTPYMGMHQVLRPDGTYQAQHRHAMYRWHVMDPIRFKDDLRVTIQALGWRGEGRYLPLQDDIASVAFWYQTLPTPAFPELPDRDYLEII
ncbi:MAG: glycoside hydrolase family 172 protein [Candidatus Poribacteria bacterium]